MIANKIQNDYKKGKIKERYFNSLLEKNGFKIKEATNYQDRKERWDVLITDIPQEDFEYLLDERIDVKGFKNEYWIEILTSDSLMNRKIGWLFGGLASFVAFERKDDFIIISKNMLQDLIFEKIPILLKCHKEAFTKTIKKLNELRKLKCDEIYIKSISRSQYLEFLFKTIISNEDKFNIQLMKKTLKYYDSYRRHVDMLTKIDPNDIKNCFYFKLNKDD